MRVCLWGPEHMCTHACVCWQAALHPTPAVCGRPREAAFEHVSGAEPFDRGFYAGPFGWIGGAAAEFVVAIRSALLHPAGDDVTGGCPPAAEARPPSTSELPASHHTGGHAVPIPEASTSSSSGGDITASNGNGSIEAVQAERRGSHAQASSSNSSSSSLVAAELNGRAGVNGHAGSEWGNSRASDDAAVGRRPQQAGAARPGQLRTISLYAGVGLVRGSDVDKEWQV